MSTEAALRRATLGIGLLVAAGTSGELVLAEHTGSAVQWLPFGLLGLGAMASSLVLAAPGRRSILALRLTAAVLVLGSAFGVWEHLEHNYVFEEEIRPGGLFRTHLVGALFGASPLLAPGAVGVVGLLAATATFRDPRITGP